MLMREALLEYAKEKKMPTDKMRGILREYIQTLILKAIYQHELGRKLYFLGGTYLRFVHHLKRFSEDLDFNGEKFGKKQFEDLMYYVQSELEREGLACRASFDYRGNLLTGKLLFADKVLEA